MADSDLKRLAHERHADKQRRGLQEAERTDGVEFETQATPRPRAWELPEVERQRKQAAIDTQIAAERERLRLDTEWAAFRERLVRDNLAKRLWTEVPVDRPPDWGVEGAMSQTTWPTSPVRVSMRTRAKRALGVPA